MPELHTILQKLTFKVMVWHCPLNLKIGHSMCFPGLIPRRLVSPSALILYGRGIQFGLQLALVVLLPRLLGPEDFVHYSLVTPLGYLLASIVCGWITGALCRFAYDFFDPAKAHQQEAAVTYFAWVGVLSLLAFLALRYGFETPYALVPPLLFSSSVKGAILGVLNATYRAREFLFANFAYAVPVAAFLYLCATQAKPDFDRILLVYIGLESIVGLLLLALSRIPFWRLHRFNAQTLRAYAVFGGPLLINGIANWFLSISDRYLLAQSATTEATANYVLSYQLGGSVIAYPAMFYLAIFAPRALAVEQSSGISAAMRYVYAQARLFFLMSPVLLAVSAAVVLSFKAYFYPAYPLDAPTVLIILSAQLVNVAGHFYYKELELTGRTLTTTRALGVAAIVNLGINVVAIPLLDALGAALATLVGYAVFTGMMCAFCKPSASWEAP
ncbi:MAG: polysaccharide biosynthesis C-terminal domain-containing protein [Gammaproteobacteria bacterium]|nr:polysaccharide biosynthesis C-terminal domain-containing protein [Gammaproteobacteria bacterium]